MIINTIVLVLLALLLGESVETMISRNYVWINENEDHSDSDCARASALAKKWSSLMSEQEERRFRNMSDYEDFVVYVSSDECDCDYCLKNDHSCNQDGENGECSYCAISTLTECETAKASREYKAAQQAERDLEIELVEDKLAAIGARMMRPYEHWNEDERHMEYMESHYDY